MSDPQSADASRQQSLPRPWWKRKWGIVAIAVVVLFAIGGVSNALKPKASVPGTPSPTLAAAATVTPTASPLPSRSKGTSSPTASSATPQPPPSPTPEPTAEPTPRPTPTPPILRTTGRGDKILRLTAQDEPTIARITNTGGSNFAVVSYAGSTYDDLLVNEIGSYSGTVYVAAGVSRLKITSSGTWTVEVKPIEAAKVWSGAARLNGTGDSVVLLAGAASGITTIKNKSHSNFAVIAYSPEGDYLDLLVNEIGNHSGEILLPDSDEIVLVVHAVGGTWSISSVEY